MPDLADKDYKTIYPDLGVPVIQAMTTLQPLASWQESVQGMTTMEVSFSAAQPEFDGTLISVPVASREQEETDPLTGALISRYAPIPGRVDRAVSLALNWAKTVQKAQWGKTGGHYLPPLSPEERPYRLCRRPGQL